MKKFKIWSIIIILVLLMFADGSLTFINTPDLSMEGNPLVAKLGLGWAALAVANIFVFIFIFITAYYSYFKYKTIYTNETSLPHTVRKSFMTDPICFEKGLYLNTLHRLLRHLDFRAYTH